MTKEERSEVCMNTISAIKNLGYEVNKKFIPLKGAKKLKENSVFYPKLSKLPDPDVKFETKTYVENIDCLVRPKNLGQTEFYSIWHQERNLVIGRFSIIKPKRK